MITLEPVKEFLTLLRGVVPDGQDAWRAYCPLHEATGDHDPSLNINVGTDGKVLLHCFVCGKEKLPQIVHAAGSTMAKLFPSNNSHARTKTSKPGNKGKGHSFPSSRMAVKSVINFMTGKGGVYAGEWNYLTSEGSIVEVVIRFNMPDGTKEFRPVSLHDGKWFNVGMEGLRPLYALPDVIRTQRIFIVEGEKKAEAGRSIGLVTTTSLNGAKSPQKTDWSHVKGKEVVIFPDNDDSGRQYANQVASLCVKAGCRSVKIVELPGLGPSEDLVEWIDNHGDAAEPESMRAEIESMVAATVEWQKPADFVDSVPTKGKRVITVVEPGNDPHRLARLFIKQKFTLANGLKTLAWWQGAYWTWDGLKWKELKSHELLAALTASVKAEFDRINIEEQEMSETKEDEGPPKVLPVTKTLLNNVANAVASTVVLPDDVTMPDWLCNDPHFPAREVLSTTKRLLHLPSLVAGKIDGIDPTPMLFSANCLNYNFEPHSTCPYWLAFLHSVWPDDLESISSLQEWFGYLLLPDTRQHKLLMLIGPPRSGKGTITRVLQLLLGESNVACPTLSSLSGPFGLWPLLNRFVALIPDARLSGRDDAVAVVERILSITGEDPQDIHRKSLPTLTGVRMPIRFVLMSNELPNMRDASGAFMTRVVLLRMTESFVGREDRTLGDKLAGELPGILNWAIEGWKRLNVRGHFIQPNSATELLNDLENLSSPIKQFVNDACNLGPNCEATVSTLFYAWQSWCEANHIEKKGTNQTFGRDLRAALPQIKQVQRRNGDGRERGYVGIEAKHFH